MSSFAPGAGLACGKLITRRVLPGPSQGAVAGDEGPAGRAGLWGQATWAPCLPLEAWAPLDCLNLGFHAWKSRVSQTEIIHVNVSIGHDGDKNHVIGRHVTGHGQSLSPL